MTQNENTYAIIVAGGQGTRMGTALPKQFLDLNGKPVLYHSIKAFADAVPGIQLILVLPAHQISYAQMILQAFDERIDLIIVAGGETRFHSVQNGLNAIPGDGIVFIHDGVRPLVSSALIHRCYQMALDKGSAIPVTPAVDSMRIVKGEESEPVDRTQLRIVQTPQTFRCHLIKSAFQQSYSPAFTDEASVLEAFGEKVHLVDGERSNLKITTPEDLLIARALITVSKD